MTGRLPKQNSSELLNSIRAPLMPISGTVYYCSISSDSTKVSPRVSERLNLIRCRLKRTPVWESHCSVRANTRKDFGSFERQSSSSRITGLQTSTWGGAFCKREMLPTLLQHLKRLRRWMVLRPKCGRLSDTPTRLREDTTRRAK